MAHSLSHSKPLDVGDVGVLDEQLPPWQDGPIDLKTWFGAEAAARPLELEIGSGKGTFLVQQAAQTPDVNYLGLEYARSYWQHAADRCRRHGLHNVKLVRAEADFFVRNYVMPGSLRQVHIYFPDPWPKKRHHKRRLIQEPFLRQLHDKLEPNGLVRIATDHEGYYQWMLEHADRVAALFERLPFTSPTSAGQDELVGTNFERKYAQQGRPFYGLVLQRIQKRDG